MNLDAVKTIVIVMMENRSFDHMLGYLSLQGDADVDGLIDDPDWLAHRANRYGATSFPPFRLPNAFAALDADPPHERPQVAAQLGTAQDGVFPLDGFVANYATAKGAASLSSARPPPVMGYFTADQIPVTAFLASNFAVCDRWFAALPAGTQPNRLMAMSGETHIELNHTPIPDQDLVYDWLTARGVRWRVYHETLPFFTLMPRWIPDIATGDHFRAFADLGDDIENEPPDELPQVIFIEPAYSDAPHIGETTDDHAPSAICGGQKFLLEVYRQLTSLPDFWAGAVMILTYDEHGGFFDHVSPPACRTDPPSGVQFTPFETLGVRVPAIVASPFVEPGSVCHELFDHTSILKLLGEKFGRGSYSASVDQRPVASLSSILTRAGSGEAPTVPSLDPYLAQGAPAAGQTPGTAPGTPIQNGFRQGLEDLRRQVDRPPDRFGDLLAAFPPDGGADR